MENMTMENIISNFLLIDKDDNLHNIYKIQRVTHGYGLEREYYNCGNISLDNDCGHGLFDDDGKTRDIGYGSGKLNSGQGNMKGTGEGECCLSSGRVTYFCGKRIYFVDSLPTVILSIRNSIAKGYIINKDLTTTPCYIMKERNLFAHGKTLHEAFNALSLKLMQKKPVLELIKEFMSAFPDKQKKYDAKDFYTWHNILTGSCDFGRKAFCTNHNIDINCDSFTVVEFINLTINTYKSKIITLLKTYYNINQ